MVLTIRNLIHKTFFLAFFMLSIEATAQIEFIGMEYQGVLNRTYVVFVSDTLVWGGKVQGPIAAGSMPYPKQLLMDPSFYADPGALAFYRGHTDPNAIKEIDKANFVYKRSDIDSMTYSDKKKWGMGDVRYSGRIFFYIKGKDKREFMLLGDVDVDHLKTSLGIGQD